MSIDEAKIAEIVAELKSTGVYVDESMAGRLPPAFQAELRQQVAASEQPVFIAMVPITRDDPDFHGDNGLLAGVLHSDVGEPGVYLTYRDITGSVDGHTYGVDYGLYDAWFAARKEHPDDLQQQLTQTITYLNNGEGREVYERLREQEDRTSTGQPHVGTDGPDVLPVAGWLAAVLVVAGVAAVIVRKSRSRGGRPATTYVPGKGYVTSRPFELPAATLSMIRQSRDRELERRAEREVLALGEAIDRTEMDGSSSGAWHAALDHYDLSRRILDRRHSQADVVGALVLSGRGRSALAAAQENQQWTPQRSCYFNPLHGAGEKTTQWTGASGSVRVPACAACVRALSRGQEPDDVLDFVVDGRARHYFDLDLEPWASTGYGALDPDLTGRLFGGDQG
ncbi:MAG: hypothetical protein EOO74_05860 [Myxococcales bacterium]|nr:MAG: hypothetical protein EOO74_05860 [Myxococcales bacterium]